MSEYAVFRVYKDYIRIYVPHGIIYLYNQPLVKAPSGKEGMPMDTFQTIMSFLSFGTFILALLTYVDKRK